MARNITLLAPADQLPAEGFDAPPLESANGAPTGRELLKHYLDVMSGSDFGFVVSSEGVELLNGHAPSVRLQHFEYGVNGNPDPHFDVSSSFCRLELTPVLAGLDEEVEEGGEDEVLEAKDLLRSFLERFQGALGPSARGFAGEKLPLLRWTDRSNGSGPAVGVQFMGVLMADEELAKELRKDAGLGEDLGLILEEAEVEAHGLRELAMSLTILGVTAGFAPQAEAGFFEDLFGGGKDRMEQQHRTVKHQYRQAAPRVDKRLLAQAQQSHTQVIVDVSKQRAYLLVNGRVAIDTPISTARQGKYTPRGEFTMTQRVRTGKTSTIYGCDLPYWMRLNQSAIGMHVGDLPGYPASAGCVRLPYDIAPLMFDGTKSGTTVRVVDSWQPQTMIAGTGGGGFTGG
jgi:hypothetical protein